MVRMISKVTLLNEVVLDTIRKCKLCGSEFPVIERQYFESEGEGIKGGWGGSEVAQERAVTAAIENASEQRKEIDLMQQCRDPAKIDFACRCKKCGRYSNDDLKLLAGEAEVLLGGEGCWGYGGCILGALLAIPYFIYIFENQFIQNALLYTSLSIMSLSAIFIVVINVWKNNPLSRKSKETVLALKKEIYQSNEQARVARWLEYWNHNNYGMNLIARLNAEPDVKKRQEIWGELFSAQRDVPLTNNPPQNRFHKWPEIVKRK